MIDLFCMIIFVYGFYVGFTKGIIRTVFYILSVLFGVIIAFRFSPDVTSLLKTAIDSTNPLLFVPAFVVTFFLSVMAIRTLARIFENGVKGVNINFVNQIIGGVVTAAFTTLLYSLIIWFGNQAHLIQESSKNESMTYSFLEKYPQTTWDMLEKAGPSLKRYWSRSLELIDQIKSSRESSETEPSIYDIEE